MNILTALFNPGVRGRMSSHHWENVNRVGSSVRDKTARTASRLSHFFGDYRTQKFIRDVSLTAAIVYAPFVARYLFQAYKASGYMEPTQALAVSAWQWAESTAYPTTKAFAFSSYEAIRSSEYLAQGVQLMGDLFSTARTEAVPLASRTLEWVQGSRPIAFLINWIFSHFQWTNFS